LRFYIPRLGARCDAARRLESELSAKNGVERVKVSGANEIVTVQYDARIKRPAAIVRSVRKLLRVFTESSPGHQEVRRIRDVSIDGGPSLHPLLLPTAATVLALIGIGPYLLTAGLLAAAALPIVARAIDGLRRRRANVDQLDVAALLMLAAMGDLVTGSVLTWLIGLGDWIRHMTMRRSRMAISTLMSPTAQQAWVEKDGVIVSVSVAELEAGDTIVLYPGDQIPVDGVITGGQALVDAKVLTGESTPQRKNPGDRVYALTMLADGQVCVRVEHIGESTRAGQIAAMIEEAPISDTRVQNYAAIIGDNLVLPIFALAGLTYLFTGSLLRAASILILDFATGIRVAAPTTILSAMTGAARNGLFIKGGRALEHLAKVTAVVFDKTGTLTIGEPVVTRVHVFSAAYSEADVLRLAASAEAKLKHPAAEAVVRAARARGVEIAHAVEMEYTMGMGVRANVDRISVGVGSAQFLQRLGIQIQPALDAELLPGPNGGSIVYVAADGILIGALAYSDRAREESRPVLQALLSRGIERIVMLTGDRQGAAEAIGLELGITDVIAEAYPEDKAEVVQRLRDEGFTVAVIGDGINDAAAFARADVGIALSHGADVARETADMVLLDGSLWGVPRAIDLARATMAVLNQNLNIVVGPTAAGLVGSIFGVVDPLISTIINNGTTVLAGLNALRPMAYSYRPRPTKRIAQ
jgi:Cu2+-exporting ATPase